MPAYLGDNDQGGEHSVFLIDMETPFIAVTSKQCDNCKLFGFGGGVFDPETSGSFSYIGVPD